MTKRTVFGEEITEEHGPPWQVMVLTGFLTMALYAIFHPLEFVGAGISGGLAAILANKGWRWYRNRRGTDGPEQ